MAAATSVATAAACAVVVALLAAVAVAARLGVLPCLQGRRRLPAAGARVPVLAALATANPPSTVLPEDFIAVVSVRRRGADRRGAHRTSPLV